MFTNRWDGTQLLAVDLRVLGQPELRLHQFLAANVASPFDRCELFRSSGLRNKILVNEGLDRRGQITFSVQSLADCSDFGAKVGNHSQKRCRLRDKTRFG